MANHVFSSNNQSEVSPGAKKRKRGDSTKEIHGESDKDTTHGSPSKVLVREGGVSLSPRRHRSTSSISMSDIPSHMSSGQILPAYGLASAGASQAPGAQTMTALEFMDLEDSGEDSDSIDKAPFFGYEVGGGVALSECCDKGKGNEVVMEDYLGENESQSSGSSSSSSSSDDELGGVKIMDFLREMEARCETLTAFPAYDDDVAMELLAQPEIPLTDLIPFRPRGRMTGPPPLVFMNDEGWTLVNAKGKPSQVPVGFAQALSTQPFWADMTKATV